ncbi:MAG TPA: thioesterase family protein [Solirubrobacterales bacterium]|nr:thioesterase family protein [Solirubrobacterales bacterium]
MDAPDSFYEPDGDGFAATALTRGPWDPGAQHAGPPSALIGREIERLENGEGFQVARISFEILRRVPIGPVQVEARLARPGRSVQMIEATLRDRENELMLARAWRIRRSRLELPPEVADGPPVPPGPDSGFEPEFFDTGQDTGYHTAMELRSVGGGFREPGPARVWMRMRHPLLPGEQPSPLQRTLIAADVGNGISAVLDWRRHVFINVDLSVHLERMPEGEWVCVDAVTIPHEHGIGTTESVLFDQRGRIGRAAQSLLLAERD